MADEQPPSTEPASEALQEMGSDAVVDGTDNDEDDHPFETSKLD